MKRQKIVVVQDFAEDLTTMPEPQRPYRPLPRSCHVAVAIHRFKRGCRERLRMWLK